MLDRAQKQYVYYADNLACIKSAYISTNSGPSGGKADDNHFSMRMATNQKQLRKCSF